MNGTDHQGEPQGSPFLFALYPAAAYALIVETPPTPQSTPSVSAAGTPPPSAGKPKQTSGAFGKPKAYKRLSDYFPAPFRLKRKATFAANAVPPERDALAEHIAEELGWDKK